MSDVLYCDLGANAGDTIESFLLEQPGAQVFAFEPNPMFANQLRDRFATENVKIIEAACWIADGESKLYLGHSLSSTIIEGKSRSVISPQFDIDYDHYVIVRTIDFPQWLLQTMHTDQRIVIKMDIEGAEYAVVQRMIDLGALSRVSELRCEWHGDRYDVSSTRHGDLLAIVESQTNLIPWT